MCAFGKGVVKAISGIVIGHLYIFLKKHLPLKMNRDPLYTPRVINKLAFWLLDKFK